VSKGQSLGLSDRQVLRMVSMFTLSLEEVLLLVAEVIFLRLTSLITLLYICIICG
jgi:hypothetical protein